MGSVSWEHKRLQTESFNGTSMRVATLHNAVGSANSINNKPQQQLQKQQEKLQQHRA